MTQQRFGRRFSGIVRIIGMLLMLVACRSGDYPRGAWKSSARCPVSIEKRLLPPTITVGYQFTCVLTPAGGAKCWGDNGQSQLGNGSFTNTMGPTPVVGLASDVLAMSSGSSQTCAINSVGEVKCWGFGYSSKLQDYGNNCAIPRLVLGPDRDVVSVSVGNGYACVLTSKGAVKCWGRNGSFFADGTDVSRETPKQMAGLSSGVKSISIGGDHACVITAAGGAMCWGANHYGALGDGTGEKRLIPTQVSGLTSRVAAISAGDWHTCALTTAGEVKCWGQYEGKYGPYNARVPTAIPGIGPNISAISAGEHHTCVLTAAGGVLCWGYNAYGQLGNGTNQDSTVPTQVVGLTSGVIALSVGAVHSCAIKTSGKAMCWGGNWYGAIGDGTQIDKTTPVEVIAFP